MGKPRVPEDEPRDPEDEPKEDEPRVPEDRAQSSRGVPKVPSDCGGYDERAWPEEEFRYAERGTD